MKPINELTIALASDHAGFGLKSMIQLYLEREGAKVVDFGCNSMEKCDFPDFAHPMAAAIEAGEIEAGIALCGTGNGMALALNHHRGIRAGLAWNVAVATLVKQHNNANVLVVPARFVSYRMAVMMVRVWLTTEFAGGRHQRRIDKILLP